MHKLTLIAALLVCGATHAQQPAADAPTLSGTSQAGINRMKGILDNVAKKPTTGVGESAQSAINTGLNSATVSADVDHMDARTVDFSIQQSDKMQREALEAYVAALPPRDRARGASVMLGDGSGNGTGQLYVFVSRSMPPSLLRAYAVDAFYMGARLVVKGLRKGDTLKEFLNDTMEAFNSFDGMPMATLDINPNLYDMFDVSVVPTVVWTNRMGLQDVGSGCQNLPDGAPMAKVNLEGPDDEVITMEKPACAKLPDSTYYKISGALATSYILDRFQEAGLPKEVADTYRAKLAERAGNVHDGSAAQTSGNAMAPLSSDIKLDRLPKSVLQGLRAELKAGNVQRSPFGPTFSPDLDDDPEYRQELNAQIRHGLGL